ncbi:hypothetical protein EIP86_002643 [Pleurotus ostreatoroseus]|nr:hypothetical protein EIP86_002643 [Pleurotus ostreatoroseus]
MTVNPSSKLPCELHLEVFRYVRDSLDNDPSPLAWLAILGVCKQWRQVALGASELWTFLRTVHPNLLKLFLKLSQSRPLDFRYVPKTVEDRTRLMKALSNILSPHFRRLQKFCVEVPLDTRFNSIELELQWQHSLHCLTHLEICNKEKRCRESISALFSSSVLTALETLILQLSSVKQIKMLRAPRLRSLTVAGNVSMHGPQALTVDEWLEILMFTPRLEVLDLQDAVLAPVNIPGQCDKVLLKRLHTIRLSSFDDIAMSANLELLTPPDFSEVTDLLISNFDLSCVDSFELISFHPQYPLSPEPNTFRFARLFEQMPGLAHLTVSSSRFMPEYVKEILEDDRELPDDIDGFASNATYYPRFPLLESLSICAWKDVFAGDLRLVLEALAERAHYGCHICELHVCCDKGDAVDRWIDVHQGQLNEVVGETRTCRSPRQERVEFVRL